MIDEAVSNQSTWTGEEAAAIASAETADDHPEAAVGAAFAAGFLLALIIKRLAR